MNIKTFTRDVRLPNADGLHLRAAALLAQAANAFTSDITVRLNDRKADAKSILDLLGLAAEQGSELTLQAHGPDSQMAINVLADTVLNSFRFFERSHA